MNVRRYFMILIGIGYCFSTYSNQPLVRNFTRKDYKSGTQNWGITQDSNNSMCFANNNGLLLFDGKSWNTTPISNGTNVRSVAFDGISKYYASTFNNFGYYEINKVGKLEFFSLTQQQSYQSNSSNELFNIHIAGSKVFFQGSKSVYYYENKVLLRIDTEFEIESSGVVNNILFISTRKNGIFMLNGNMFIRVQGSEMLESKKVCTFLPFIKNTLLIVTRYHGVFLFDGLSVSKFSTNCDAFLMSNQVFCAATNGKMLAFGSVQGGLAVQNIETGVVDHVNTFSGLQNNTVLSTFFDKQDNLWLGLDKGIDFVLLNSPIRNVFRANNIYGSGYTSYAKNNLMYFGTNQGLYITNYPVLNNASPQYLTMIKGMEGQIWCLNEIENTLFCGDDQGAFIIKGQQIERINGLSGTWRFLKLKKWPDRILGCSYQGLFVLVKSGNKWTLSHFLKGSFKESSPMFEEDSDGKIWFSHWQKGLYRLELNATADSIIKIDIFDTEKGFPTNRNNTFFRVGNEIIFSSESGLYQYNKNSDRMTPYEKWNRLFQSTPRYIRLHESPNGDVWCVSGSFFGLARKQKNNSYVIDSLTYRLMQSKMIAGFEHFNFIDNNQVIINTEDGFSLMKSGFKFSDKKIFKVYLSGIIAKGTNETDIVLTASTQESEIDKIAKHNNTLRFEFSAPEYQKEGMVEYSYLLEDYDVGWSKFDQENIKEYSQLPRGKYTFNVKARNMLQADVASCTYTFEVLPAWYESIVAFIFYGLLIVLLIVALIVFINHRSKLAAMEMKKTKELEFQEQKAVFETENLAKKREIKELKNQQLQYELRHKAQDLATSTMNLIRKNEMLQEIMESITKINEDIRKSSDIKEVISRLTKMERNIKQNIDQDKNWKKFEANFDIVYENYLKRLGEAYTDLNVCDKKICAYIKMDLSSKDMAPLLNMSIRSIETTRYRIRQKLNLEREVNLAEFLQKF